MEAAAGFEVGLRGEPADQRVEVATDMRTVVGARQHVAADDVDLIGKLGGDGHPGERLVDLAPARSPQTGDRRGESAGQHYHFVADSEPPPATVPA